MYERISDQPCDISPIIGLDSELKTAEEFGNLGVRTAFESMFENMKSDYVMVTKLEMCLTRRKWKTLISNPSLSILYCRLEQEVDDFAMRNLRGKEMAFYIKMTI